MQEQVVARQNEEIKRALISNSPYRLTVGIGPVTVELKTGDADCAYRLSRYFKEFKTVAVPDITVELHVARQPELWNDDDPEFQIRQNHVNQRDFVASRSFDGRVVAVIDPEVDDAFHNLLRWAVPVQLLKKNSFLMHGNGIARQRAKDGLWEGYVFFGQSGAGKSTTAELIAARDPSAVLLGDDGVIISWSPDGTPLLHAAPLGCGYSREAPPALTVSIVGMYSLQQHGSHAIEPLRTSEATAAILASAMNVRHEEAIDRRVELALRFAKLTRRLKFARNSGFWPLVTEQGDPNNV